MQGVQNTEMHDTLPIMVDHAELFDATIYDDLPIPMPDEKMALDEEDFELIPLNKVVEIPVKGRLGDSTFEGVRDGDRTSGRVYVHTAEDPRREVARIAYTRGAQGLDVRVEKSVVDVTLNIDKIDGLVRVDSWDLTFWMELTL